MVAGGNVRRGGDTAHTGRDMTVDHVLEAGSPELRVLAQHASRILGIVKGTHIHGAPPLLTHPIVKDLIGSPS